MANLLTEVHREIPEASRSLAKAVLDVQAKERRAVRREGKGDQREHDTRSSPSATTEELEAVRSELAARINRCLYGQGTVFDRRFIIDNLPVFEDPVGDGSVTILDLTASLA